MGKTVVIILTAAMILLLMAMPAVADTEHVSHSSSTVTGAETLAGALREIQHVQIGSSATTITLQGATMDAPMVVEYSTLTGSVSDEDGGGNALVPLLTLSVGAAALRSVLGLLRSIGRLGNIARGR